jgi:lipopolysaccharide/colanic/teichoic acid biosynthesis glycosyltransferase
MATLPSYDLPEPDVDIVHATPNESGIIRHRARGFAPSVRPAVHTDLVWTEPPLAVRATKRAIDVLAASIGLLCSIWLFPVIALTIWLDSPGPIFYRQRRAGRFLGRRSDGRFVFENFSMLKLRTMRPDAEQLTGPVLAMQDDPRITRVGRFLRKTRLDELPQLYSVLVGDMSLVGPRPERPELFANLVLAIPYFEERMHGVKPGITGFAQVSLGYSGRAREGSEIKRWESSLVNPFGLPGTEGSEADDMRMKLLYDLAYVAALDDFWSYLRLELYVIFKTPLVMLGGLGR